MSHSTTATSTYPLTKYSKSYPQGTQTGLDSTAAEWQHFTNPSIRLMLDIKKGSELESVRLCIVWSMEQGLNSDRRDVIFEDLDLLALSYLPQRLDQKHTHSLPLKAVYRDNIVGIRYLHPIDFKETPIYRRFQITFLSSASVLEFIGSISAICPCKANPSVTPAPKAMNPQSDSDIYSQPMSLSRQLSMVNYNTASTPVLARAQKDEFRFPVFSSPSLAPQSSVHTSSYLPPGPKDCPISSTVPGYTLQAPAGSLASRQIESSNSASQLQLQNTAATSSGKGVYNGNLNSLPSVASDKTLADISSSILASETLSIYDLPRHKLEQLVGDVVREEGFANLVRHTNIQVSLTKVMEKILQLENVSSLWDIKRFVGI